MTWGAVPCAPSGRPHPCGGPGESFEPVPTPMGRARGAVAIDDPRTYGRESGSARALLAWFSLPRGARGPELNRRENT